jgi:hypothetical protein
MYTNKPVEFLSTERLLNPPTAIDVSGVCLFFQKVQCQFNFKKQFKIKLFS